MNSTVAASQKSLVPLVPFLKWAGGKRWLAPKIAKRLGKGSGRYIEPFAGSAAIYFAARPKRALLADVNGALINTFRCVRDKPSDIESLLLAHQALHSAEHYYSTRSQRPTAPLDHAAQFIYLNRTCWNGLYRVNRKGEFNVPIGTKTSVVLDTDCWDDLADQLSGAQLLAQDFEKTIDAARRDDVVFADPPYTVKHNFNGFIKYNESLFSWDDQVRLRNALVRARDRGVKVVATNADHSSVKELYRADFRLRPLTRASVLAGDAAFRGRFNELLITSPS
jgi:DNA adenine methylase